MRVEAGELAGAREGTTSRVQRRIPSERSDILYLTRALAILCDEVTDVLGPPGSGTHLPLRDAVYTARTAVYRGERNQFRRDLKAKRRRAGVV